MKSTNYITLDAKAHGVLIDIANVIQDMKNDIGAIDNSLKASRPQGPS